MIEKLFQALVLSSLLLSLQWIRKRPTRAELGAIAFNLAWLPCFIAMTTVIEHLLPPFGLPEPLVAWPDGHGAQIVVVAGMVATFDFFYYWVHRAQHAFEWLWIGHALHHSDRHVNATTRNRTHWLEAPITLAFVVAPTFSLFAPPPAAVFVLVTGWSYFIHADVDLRLSWCRNVVTSPRYHRIHHSNDPSHHNKNFAALVPAWDMLFGTYVDPRAVRVTQVGLSAGQPTGWRDVLGQNVSPCIETFRSIARSGRRLCRAVTKRMSER